MHCDGFREYTYKGNHSTLHTVCTVAFKKKKIKFINFWKIVWKKIMFLSPKQGLARIQAFFKKSQWQCTHWTIHFSYNFNSCSSRLREGIGPYHSKDKSCDSTLASCCTTTWLHLYLYGYTNYNIETTTTIWLHQLQYWNNNHNMATPTTILKQQPQYGCTNYNTNATTTIWLHQLQYWYNNLILATPITILI